MSLWNQQFEAFLGSEDVYGLVNLGECASYHEFAVCQCIDTNHDNQCAQADYQTIIPHAKWDDLSTSVILESSSEGP
jgi:hypothetical protein